MNIAYKLIIFCLGLFFSGQSLYAYARTLKMAANFGGVPFVYIDSNGTITGFDVELIRAVGKLKGFDVTVVPAVFPHVFDELKSKQIDFIGNVYNSKERKELYNLTIPHYIDKIEFLTLANKNIVNPLANGNTIATLAFSPIEESFQHSINVDYPSLKTQSELTGYLGFKDLFLDKADALFGVQSNINSLIKKHDKFKYKIFDVPKKYQQNIEMSFLTTKDNQELINDINSGIKELKENGTYDRLKQKYNL